MNSKLSSRFNFNLKKGNSGHGLSTLPLLEDVFAWARKANTMQPLTSGMKIRLFSKFQVLLKQFILLFKAYGVMVMI